MFIIFERLSILIKKTISIIPDRTWRIKTALSVLTSRAMTCVRINGCSRQFVCFWLGFLIFSPFKMDKTCTVINCNQILCWWYSGLKDAAFHVLFWMTSQQTTCSGPWNCQLDWVIRQLWKNCCHEFLHTPSSQNLGPGHGALSAARDVRSTKSSTSDSGIPLDNRLVLGKIQHLWCCNAIVLPVMCTICWHLALANAPRKGALATFCDRLIARERIGNETPSRSWMLSYAWIGIRFSATGDSQCRC